MKLTKITLGIATAVAIFVGGCTSSQTVSEESLGLRKTDLYTEATTTGDKTNYAITPAGTSQKIERAYQNAPPMIPHDTEGMLPIVLSEGNQCMNCHEPAVAESVGAVPVPKTHFTNFRPTTALAADGKITKEGKEVENTSDFVTGAAKPLHTLSGARFNCTQCHAPQSQGELVVGNTFQGDFKTQNGKNTSNLIDTINEGVK